MFNITKSKLAIIQILHYFVFCVSVFVMRFSNIEFCDKTVVIYKFLK